MKFTYPLAIAAALAFGCAHGSTESRSTTNDGATTPNTPAGSSYGTSPSASVSDGAAHGTNTGAWNNGSSTPPSSPSYGSSPSASVSDGAAHGTNTGAWNNGSTAPASGPSYGSSPSASVSDGSAHGTNTGAWNNSGTSNGAVTNGSTSTDSANLRMVTGSVVKVDAGSITLDQAAGGVTLSVDSSTQVIRGGHSIAGGITSIHEGEQIRASFDPASNRANKIEEIGKHHHHGDTANPQ